MTYAIGTPVYTQNEQGYISAANDATASKTFVIGGCGLQPVAIDYEVTFPTRVTTLSDGIVKTWVERAAKMGLDPIAPDALATMRADALARVQLSRDAMREKREADALAYQAFKADAAGRIPEGTKAVIVAELVKDDSDSMSDYFNSIVQKTVILAFSTHTRDVFSEMRRASLNHPDTAHLFDAPSKAEHREKYSMGGGYYLKAGYRHSNRWRVKKWSLHNDVDSLPMGEWSLGDTNSAPPVISGQASPANIVKVKHTKHGWDMWIVTMGERVERDEYTRLLSDAKARGGWYSRAWGASPAGFAFKAESDAQAFALAMGAAPGVAPDHPESVTPRVAAPASNDLPAKFRALADGMESDIADKFRDRLSNTPKRQREAGNARLDGYHLTRTRDALRALANHIESGSLPAELRGVTTKAGVHALTRGEYEHGGGYYESPRETGRPAQSTPATLALWAMLAPRSEADKARDALATKIQGLQFANIPGYFPTPAPIVAMMIEAADIPKRATILEPSAGSGAIIDALRACDPDLGLLIYERHARLRDILESKGYFIAGHDFTESDQGRLVDRVLMNPPFENGQDMEHVRRAFDHLKPGGRLVAIMSLGPFFRMERRAIAFRQWFNECDGVKEELPAGSFKESGTGVGTVMVTIDRA